MPFVSERHQLFYPSPYIGDMGDVRTVKALKESVKRMEELLEVKPEIVACDMHPSYNTRAAAEEMGLPVFPVQHHYALSFLVWQRMSGQQRKRLLVFF